MRTPTTPLRWGILGTGKIAERFVAGLRALPDAEVVAVGSRGADSAARFADKWGIPYRHSSYASLAEDERVDVVYVATPHPVHRSATVLCLEGGKHVLCEKPLALNAEEADEMIATARCVDRFLMEGMWTRFSPAIAKMRELIGSGTIGEIRMLSATIGGYHDYDPEHRLFSPALGGGSLLDVGVYPVAFASMFLGEFTKVDAHEVKAPTGVDSQVVMVLTSATGALGMLGCSIEAHIPRRADIIGTRGRIELEEWYSPTGFVLRLPGEEPMSFDFPREGNGFEYEAAAVQAHIRQGSVESPTMPWAESLRIARTLDDVRARIGVTYPGEAPKSAGPAPRAGGAASYGRMEA